MASLTSIVLDPNGYDLPVGQRRVLRWTVYIGYAALIAGVFHGLANALSYAGISMLGWFPGLHTYYQGLTAHGVANVLIFTFSFSNAFLPLMTARALARPLNGALLWGSFVTLVLGNVLAIYAVVGLAIGGVIAAVTVGTWNRATVMVLVGSVIAWEQKPTSRGAPSSSTVATEATLGSKRNSRTAGVRNVSSGIGSW